VRILGWIIVGLVALDVVAAAVILLRDGGREQDAWFVFLTLPLLIVVLTILYFFLRLFLGASQTAN
jgi:hypothetical protein